MQWASNRAEGGRAEGVGGRAAAEERRKPAALARFVRTGQSDEHGLKTLVARAHAGAVIVFVAMVDRIAEIMALHGDTDAADVRRSKAVGIVLEWRSPHGYWFRVDRRGTHALGREDRAGVPPPQTWRSHVTVELSGFGHSG